METANQRLERTLRELREEILTQLKKVNQVNCPKIYKKTLTSEGYEEIEARIIRMVINHGITPESCIPQIESEL